jgi:ABC-type transporter Mla subunit MlaD
MSGPIKMIRRRLDIVPAAHRTRPLLMGFIVLGITLFALISAARRDIPFTGPHGRALRAEFATANQVSKRTVVRVAGIEVGRVDKVEASSTPSRSSLVTMRITDDNIVVHRDATAQIRWRTLFGGLMYIDLDPGSPSAPKLGGEAIPVKQTGSQVEFDQLLQPYDGSTLQAQRDVFKGLRYSFADPAGIGKSIDTLAPTLPTIQRGLAPLRGQQSDDLRGLVAATAKTVKGLDQNGALAGLVAGANRTLAVTEARRQQLGQLLDLSPPALDSTFITMRRLRTTLDHLDPLAAELRPGARALGPAARAATPAFQQTEAVLREARPLLRALGPAFDSLAGASRNGVPLLLGLDPTLKRLDSNLLPYLRATDPETRLRNYEAIGPFWSTLASAASEFDAQGHRIRFTVPFGANSFLSLPGTATMASACAASSLGLGKAGCTKLATSLEQGMFGTAKAGKR